MKSLFIFLMFCSFLFGDGLSFQGYSGLINTPNAQVIEEGDSVLHFNNQFDNNLRYYDYSRDINYEENYIFGIGFLPNLELVGRLVEANGYARDLSANIKYKIPLYNRFLPNIAIGVQDLGGSFNFYDNKYIVADKKIGFLRASIGYGKSGRVVRDKRMNGLFGGVESQLFFDWLSLILENDSKENHIGLKLKLPLNYSNMSFNAIFAQNLDSSDNSFGFNLVIPLKRNIDKNQTLNRLKNISFISKKKNLKIKTLFGLKKLLLDFGFEDVRVGIYKKDTIYIECENSIFDRNDIDALGFIIGSIVNSGLNYKYFSVTLLKNRLQIINVSGTNISFKRYIEEPSYKNLYNLKTTLLIKRIFDTSNVKFIDRDIKNSSLFKPEIELSPGIISTIGTEVGVFDYLLSLRSKLYFPLYKGLIVTAMYEMPFSNSDNFDNGEVLNLMYKDKCNSRWVYANISQTFHYKNLFNTVSGGVFENKYYGLFNQTNLSFFNGKHSFNFKVGTFKHKDINDNTHSVYEGGYRYYYSKLDMFSLIKYGRYWDKDSGYTLELKRFFKDNAISLEYRNLKNKYVGIKVSIPLTFRKIEKSNLLGQIRGKKDFNYAVRTSYDLADGSNRIIISEGVLPKVGIDLESYYLNRDRLNKEYILEHIDRMREAYLIYLNN